ncbi:MAG: xanthine dehydrogenase family protein molybdopterin-binding subunit [Deltaproteobacteria bacterium]|nr:xanthine dehydrogenase family protein molybdopterin-binding subunit [Deltaproteobacteria bacterium]
MKTLLTRREWLKQSLTGAGLTLVLTLTPFGYKLTKAEEGKDGPSFSPSVWLRISPDNTVTAVINKAEMGQGVSTSLPMIIAEELEADWQQIRFVQSPAGPQYIDPESGMQSTGGSNSIRHMVRPLRQAAAAAREMLVEAAARSWGVPKGDCQALLGRVKNVQSGRSLTYGQLSEKASQLPVPPNPVLKKEKEFRLIGTSPGRLDIPDKVAGTAVFGMDVMVPGMVYGTLARPPAYGAKALSFDREKAEKTPGVLKVLPSERGIIVLADGQEAAWKGREALGVRWDKGLHPDLNNETVERDFLDHLQKKGLVAKEEGQARKIVSGPDRKIESVYVLPYLAHATMEPIGCTARVTADRCDLWVSTQNQTRALELAAKVTGLKSEQIHCQTTYLGGGFGRRGDVAYMAEALLASKAVGKPVKIIWTREEDLQNDVYRPGNCCRIAGALDGQGRLLAWSHKVVVPSIFERFAPQRMEKGIDPAAVNGIVNLDYEIPNLYVEYVKMDNPIPVGFWRSVGNSHNGFTVESFMDELAWTAKKDPLEFRLELLKNHLPARKLLELAADKAGWNRPLKKGQALGLAYCFAYGSRVVHVAEVSVNEKDGKITVHKVTSAVDCGPLNVHPAGLKAQVVGAAIMGLSAALKEKIDFEKGGVSTANFHNYPELSLSEAPDCEVHILRNQATPGGVGEPGLPPVAPAVANAVFAATGKRIRRLPMTPAEVLKAPKEVRS